MPLKNKGELEAHILKFLEEKNEISIQQIMKAVKLVDNPSNRRVIQRTLARMIEKGAIQTRGKARARVYILAFSAEQKHTFNDIFVSKESGELLRYVLQPLQTRKPVAFNANFLKYYIPNQTFYLSSSLRQELFATGKVENVIRPSGTYARNILNRLLIDLSWNSSRLEGNTYSLLETKRLIELGENAAGKDATETQMILNHKDAIEYIVESANEVQITAHEVRSIHALLSENLLGDPGASGRVRNIAVGISGTTYIPPDNPHILKECFDIFIEKINQIEDPFEQSFFALVQLSYMQAFEDVNKRTSRLAANIPLIKRNLKPLSFIDVSQSNYVASLIGVYEKNDVSLMRDLYVWAYKRSALRYSAIQQAVGEPNLFKLKYKSTIQDIVRKIILENIEGNQIVSTIKHSIEALNLSSNESNQLFQVIETEIMSLHEGNIARFKIRPSEFQKWNRSQKWYPLI